MSAFDKLQTKGIKQQLTALELLILASAKTLTRHEAAIQLEELVKIARKSGIAQPTGITES